MRGGSEFLQQRVEPLVCDDDGVCLNRSLMALPQSSARAPGCDRLDHRNDDERHAATQQEAGAPVVAVQAIQVHEHEHIECEEVELLRHAEKRFWDRDLRVVSAIQGSHDAGDGARSECWQRQTWRASSGAAAAIKMFAEPRRLYVTYLECWPDEAQDLAKT